MLLDVQIAPKPQVSKNKKTASQLLKALRVIATQLIRIFQMKFAVFDLLGCQSSHKPLSKSHFRDATVETTGIIFYFSLEFDNNVKVTNHFSKKY